MTLSQIVVLFFIAAFLGIIALYMSYMEVKTSPRYHLKKRLRGLAIDASNRRFPSDLRLEILREMSPFERFLYRFKPVRRLDGFIDMAGLKADVRLFIILIIGFAALGYCIGFFIGLGWKVPFIFVPVGFVVPLIYLSVKKTRRFARFTGQFPDALSMLSRSLRAGHSISAAFEMVGNEMPEPVAGLFKSAYEEQTFGLSMREAIGHMARRMPGTDVQFFVMATNIHREIGGNLGEVLDRLAHTIRERLRIRRQVRVYTAQARLSGYILAVVPIVMAVFLWFILPGYIQELWTVTWGKYAIGVAVFLQVLGFLVIRNIINIRI
jgi:tight adherence protein B